MKTIIKLTIIGLLLFPIASIAQIKILPGGTTYIGKYLETSNFLSIGHQGTVAAPHRIGDSKTSIYATNTSALGINQDNSGPDAGAMNHVEYSNSNWQWSQHWIVAWGNTGNFSVNSNGRVNYTSLNQISDSTMKFDIHTIS